MFGLTPLRRTYTAALRDLASSRAEVRASAAHDLGLVGDTSPIEAADALVGVLNDASAAVRVAALTALATLGARHSVDAVAARTDDTDAEVRQVATMTLAEVGGERALGHLRRLIEHRQPEVRFQALLGLMEVHPQEGLEVALAAVDADDPWIASEAALQIGGLLAPVQRSTESMTARKAYEVDAATRERAAEVLALALDSAHDRVVVAAAIVLGRLSDARAVPVLSHFILGRRTVAGDDAAELMADAIAALGVAPAEVAGEARVALDVMASRVLPTERRRLCREALATLDARTSCGGGTA